MNLDTGALVRHPARDELLFVEWVDEGDGETGVGWWDLWWGWERATFPTRELTLVLASQWPRDRETS